ncbi:unnamed protein product [Alternaria alternata]
MSAVPWKQEINFGSALLLHSCITVFLKEISNGFAVLYHLSIRHRDKAGIKTSIVLDGYSSVFSKDHDGELAELYFTNTSDIRLDILRISIGGLPREKPSDADHGIEKGWSIHLVRYSVRELLHVDLCRSSLEGFA